MADTFQDLNIAARTKAAIESIVKGVLARERPLPRLGTVTALDTALGRAEVLIGGESGNAFYRPYGSVQPTVGSTVRLEGRRGRAYITEVLDGRCFHGGGGDETAPPFAIEGDLDTGIYGYAANALGFAAGGLATFRMLVDGGTGYAHLIGSPEVAEFRNTQTTAVMEAIRLNGTANRVDIFVQGSTELSLTGTACNIPSVYSNSSADTNNNVRVNGSGGQIMRSTSRRELKRDIEDIDDAYVDELLDGFKVYWYRSRLPADDPRKGWFGGMADEVPRRWATFDDDTDDALDPNASPMGVNYTGMIPVHQRALQIARQERIVVRQRVDAVEADVATLQAENAALRSDVDDLQARIARLEALVTAGPAQRGG